MDKANEQTGTFDPYWSTHLKNIEAAEAEKITAPESAPEVAATESAPQAPAPDAPFVASDAELQAMTFNQVAQYWDALNAHKKQLSGTESVEQAKVLADGMSKALKRFSELLGKIFDEVLDRYVPPASQANVEVTHRSVRTESAPSSVASSPRHYDAGAPVRRPNPAYALALYGQQRQPQYLYAAESRTTTGPVRRRLGYTG